MRILVIHGSMRKGNTYALTKEIMKRLLDKPDVEFTEIGVSDLALPFCRSCHVCFTKGEENCPHYDVMRNVETALAGCDGVIMGGATYMWALNAAMKNLLDHLSYMFHRPAFFGKKGMVVTTSTGAGEKAVAKYLKTVLGQWGINGAAIVSQTAKKQKMVSPDKTAAKLDRAAERFYQSIASKRFIAPTLRNIAVHNAFRAMSLSDYSESERDTAYWRQDGFRDRAYPVKAGPGYVIGAFVYAAAKYMTNVLGKKYVKQ